MADITVIASNNMFGHYADLIIRHTTGKEVHSVFPRRFDIKNMDDYIDPQSTILIIVGHAFFANHLGYLRERFQEIDFDTTVPFTEVIHIAGFGAEINIPDITSYVDEEKSITTTLSKILQDGTDLLDPVELDGGTQKLIKALEEYHQYKFNTHENSLPLHLKLLSDTYRGDVYKAIEIEGKRLKYDVELAKILYHNMKDYVNDKLDKVEVRLINGVVVLLTYAEDHHNELAHKLINSYVDAGYNYVVVMIGKQTRGDDMFHIRVSNEVGMQLNAEELALAINNGKGNEHAATVFLTKPRELIIGIVADKLTEYFNHKNSV